MKAETQKQKGRAQGTAIPHAPMQERTAPTQQNICTIPIINNPLGFYKGLIGFCV